MKTQIIRITKDWRINVPKDFVNIMGLEPDSFVILQLDEETKTLSAHKAKVVPDN